MIRLSFLFTWCDILPSKIILSLINILQTGKLEVDVDILSNHNMAMDIVVRWIFYKLYHQTQITSPLRLLKIIGCPHGCSDKPVWASGEFLRSQCVSLLSRLHWIDKKEFGSFMKSLIDHRSVTFLLAFFHSYLGFCSDTSNTFSPGMTNTSRRTEN